jgi:hypothetical protein
LGDLHIDERDILKLIIKEEDVRVCIGFNWLRIGSSGGLL